MLFERILQLCEANCMTIYALEKATGIKKGTIQKWKEAIPMTSNLIIVADYFGVSLDYLLGRTDNPQSHKDSGIFSSALLDVAKIIKRAECEIQAIMDSCNTQFVVVQKIAEAQKNKPSPDSEDDP